ncbi:MAG: ATP-binding protein [Crocinitomicaceae bacterium]|nr:ATP-binding protein [Crocinitomicaceae bacterium]
MSDLVQEFLGAWEAELLQLRPNDPLIDLPDNAFVATETELWTNATIGRQILKDVRRIERERGVLALVHFEGLLTWQKGEKSIQTPVFLRECTAIHHQTQQIVSDDKLFVNPFISVLLQKTLGFDLELKDPSAYIQALLDTKLFSQYTDRSGLANLHPQRYELRKEWEALHAAQSYSPALHQIIGDNLTAEPAQQNMELKPISSLDPDQKSAVEKAQYESEVIYGPPGTGKSVVLSNIIGQAILNQQNALVVADKPVALEVLLGKLAQQQLDHCCVFLSASQTTAGFYKQLQVQFERLLQADAQQDASAQLPPFRGAPYWEQRKQIEHATALRFDEILHVFGAPIQSSARPTKRWQAWLSKQQFIRNLQPTTLAVLPLLQKYWQEASNQDLHQDWQNWQNWSSDLLEKHQIANSPALDLFVEQSLRCIQFEGKLYQTYSELLDQDVALQLKRLYQYQQLDSQKEQLLQTLEAWKQVPTPAEWTILKTAATAAGWFQQRKWRKLEKTWLRLPGLDVGQLENQLKKYWQNQSQRANLKEKFARFGIQNLETEIGLLIPLLKQHNTAHWQWYRNLSRTAIEQLCQAHQQAHQFQQLHQKLFTQMAPEFAVLQKTILAEFAQLSLDLQLLQQLPFELWESLADLKGFEQTMHAEFWADLRSNYPALYQFEAQQISGLIEEDLQQEARNWQQNSAAIRAVQQLQFKQLQKLLTEPLQKLTNDQKELRQQLRKGKAILVKEMAKTRQHMSIAALFEGPAAHWLRVIFPIWLCTPTTLAKTLPMRIGHFDVGIFDEASQLPLSSAVGALQRVQKCVVAGDPQQMRPQSYFGQSAEGVVDLLHQAAFYLPSQHLRYHYRSEDPSLIAFSNQHFYQNSLIVWPSKPAATNGIFDHYLEDGRYTQQQNQIEAKSLAQQLRTLLPSEQKIGVVAFSETQLNCIYQELSSSEQAILETRIQDRSAFFLPLEKVQGEECEILLISFGFAKNEAEQFSLKLGPMAQAQSGRRLNVLLTRAQKALHFYSSIRSTDFPTKRSAATNRLWEWFVFLENSLAEQTTYDANERLASAQDYPTFLNYYRVLKQREALPTRV